MSWVNTNKVLSSTAKANAIASGSKTVGQQRSRLSMTMYNEPPDGEISLEEFERFAIDRLQGTYFDIIVRRDVGRNTDGMRVLFLLESMFS